MNVSHFGVKSSRVRVTVGSNIPQNALYGLVVLSHVDGGIIVDGVVTTAQFSHHSDTNLHCETMDMVASLHQSFFASCLCRNTEGWPG